MTLEEQLDIIQAAIDGKEIEFYISLDEKWITKNILHNTNFNFQNEQYRIKPKPKKEIKLHQYLLKNLTDNTYVCSPEFYSNLKEYIKDYKNLKHYQVIKELPYTEVTVTKD